MSDPFLAPPRALQAQELVMKEPEEWFSPALSGSGFQPPRHRHRDL
jgi:hypothetical protein